MPEMRELFEKIADGGKVELEDGSVAIRKCNILVWNNTENAVDVALILHGEWSIPVEEEEKEIETEKWCRSDGSLSQKLLYNSFGPCTVMERKNFLRWVGKVPNGGTWPGDKFVIWAHENHSGFVKWRHEPHGYVRQIFAEYAEMRVEK